MVGPHNNIPNQGISCVSLGMGYCEVVSRSDLSVSVRKVVVSMLQEGSSGSKTERDLDSDWKTLGDDFTPSNYFDYIHIQ